MRAIKLATLAFLAVNLPAAWSSRAAAKENAFHPVGVADLYTGTLAHFDLQLGTGDHLTAVVPQIGFQYGLGSFAASLDLGLSYADVDNWEDEVWPGNIVLGFKGRHCLGGNWTTCFGGEFSLGIGLADVDTDSWAELEESAAEAFSLGAGSLADLRGRMFAAGTQHFVFEPVLAASTTNGMFIFHAFLGVGIYTALDDVKVLGVEADTDNEAALLYGLNMGAVLADLFGGTLGFRGFSTLTLEEDHNFFSLDFTLRLLLGGISPAVRFAIPLDDTAQDVYDVVITFGVTAEI
jgi:hypothetical protein